VGREAGEHEREAGHHEPEEDHAPRVGLHRADPSRAPDVEQKRLAYLERSYRALGETRARARQRARHALAAYLGTVALVGTGALSSERELRAFMRHLEVVLTA
jgi:hypothetical protein